LVIEAITPNPIRQQTSITISLPRDQRTVLEIWDANGRRVRTLLSDERRAGRCTVEWNGCDASGRPVPSGAYTLRLLAGQRIATARMLVAR
jgi:flagellar hook assembly protein FlgD